MNYVLLTNHEYKFLRKVGYLDHFIEYAHYKQLDRHPFWWVYFKPNIPFSTLFNLGKLTSEYGR
jgi:hypothetical protein